MQRTLFPLLAAVVLSLSCSEEEVTDSPDLVRVNVTPNAFEPATITVKAGASVRWTWMGGSHNVVSGENCTEDGIFKSGEPAAGGTFEQRFETPGTYPYYCRVHCEMGMTGTVIVQ